jgi:putative transposase
MCIVPKLFPTFKNVEIPSPVLETMKLNQKKIRYLIRKKQQGLLSSTIAVHLKVSKRRVNQIWREYNTTGILPINGQNVGRPKKPLSSDEEAIVKEAYEQYRFGARMLESIIRKEWHTIISHNRIHKYLLKLGYASENERKKKRRRWVRYEREHSLSAGHIDWHEKGINETMVCAIIDDSSRMILAGGEYSSCNTENSKRVVDQVVERYWHIGPMRELILDRGGEFGAHRTNEKGEWDGEFKRYIESLGIRPIRIRRQHPQTNGKIEKWFDCYRLHRRAFNSFDEFAMWYNNRPHGSLDFDRLETPEQAFWNRLPDGTLLGMAIQCLGWE